MDKQRRGEDATDGAPKKRGAHEAPPEQETRKDDRQDGANDDERTDGGRAIPGEDLSSANDE